MALFFKLLKEDIGSNLFLRRNDSLAQIMCGITKKPRVASESFYISPLSVFLVNICVIGCGAIGTTIARAVEPMHAINIVYLTDRSKECATLLQQKMTKVRYVPDIVPILHDIK